MYVERQADTQNNPADPVSPLCGLVSTPSTSSFYLQRLKNTNLQVGAERMDDVRCGCGADRIHVRTSCLGGILFFQAANLCRSSLITGE